jgi:hypothetical protein
VRAEQFKWTNIPNISANPDGTIKPLLPIKGTGVHVSALLNERETKGKNPPVGTLFRI